MDFQQNGLTVKENQSLFFQAEDKDGNILATNNIKIYQIGNLNPDNFYVDIICNLSGNILFTPHFKNNNASVNNDIYCKLSNTDNVRVLTYDDVLPKDITEDISDYYRIENHELGGN